LESFIYYVTLLASVFTQGSGNLLYYGLSLTEILSLMLIPVALILFVVSLPITILATPIVLVVLGIMYFSDILDFIEASFVSLDSIITTTPFDLGTVQGWMWVGLGIVTLVQALVSLLLTTASIWPFLWIIETTNENGYLSLAITAIIDGLVTLMTPLPYLLIPLTLLFVYQGFGDQDLRDWIYNAMALVLYMIPVGILFAVPSFVMKTVIAFLINDNERVTVLRIAQGSGIVTLVGAVILTIGIIGLSIAFLPMFFIEEYGLSKPKSAPLVSQANRSGSFFEDWELPSEWW